MKDIKDRSSDGTDTERPEDLPSFVQECQIGNPLRQIDAAVYMNRLSCNIASVRSRKMAHHGRHIFRRAGDAEQGFVSGMMLRIGKSARLAIRGNPTWCNEVRGDAARRQFGRKSFGETDKAGFG